MIIGQYQVCKLSYYWDNLHIILQSCLFNKDRVDNFVKYFTHTHDMGIGEAGDQINSYSYFNIFIDNIWSTISSVRQ